MIGALSPLGSWAVVGLLILAAVGLYVYVAGSARLDEAERELEERRRNGVKL